MEHNRSHLRQNLHYRGRNDSYWGTLSCLYASLQPEQVDVIEQTNSTNQQGKYAIARQLLDSSGLSKTDNPLIAITLADVLESQGLQSERSDVLRKALKNYPQWEEKQDKKVKELFRNMKTLLSLMYATAEVRSRGTLDVPLKSAFMACANFAKCPYKQATQIEARCVTEYNRVREFCQSVSALAESLPDSLYQPLGVYQSDPVFHKVKIQSEFTALRMVFQQQADHSTSLRIATEALLTIKPREPRRLIEFIDTVCSQILEIASLSGHHLVVDVQLSVIEYLLEQDATARQIDKRLRCCSTMLHKKQFRNDQSPLSAFRLRSARLRHRFRRRLEVNPVDFLQLGIQAYNMGAYLLMFQNITLAVRIHDDFSLRSGSVLDSKWDIIRTHCLAIAKSTIRSESIIVFALLDLGVPLTWRDDRESIRSLVTSFRKTCPDFDLPSMQQQLTELAGVAEIGEESIEAQHPPWESVQYTRSSNHAGIATLQYLPVPDVTRLTWKWVKRMVQSQDVDVRMRRTLYILVQWAETDVRHDFQIPACLEVEIALLARYETISSVERNIAGVRESSIGSQMAGFANFIFGLPMKPHSLKKWCEIFPSIEKWLRFGPSTMNEKCRHLMLKLLQNTRVSTVLTTAETAKIGTYQYDHYYELLCHETLDFCRILQNLNGQVRDPSEIRETQLLALRSVASLFHSDSALENNLITVDVVDDCLTGFGKKLSDYHQRTGDHFRLYESLRLRALISCARFLGSSTTDPDLPLNLCDLADLAFRTIHHRASFGLSQHHSTLSNDFPTTFSNHQKLSEQAVLVCSVAFTRLNQPNPERIYFDKVMEEMVVWDERLQARRLLQDLGVRKELPQHTIRLSTIDVEGRKLLEYGRLLICRLSESEKGGNVKLCVKAQTELENVLGVMRKRPNIEQLLDIRESYTAIESDIQAMVNRCESKVAVVNYMSRGEISNAIFITVYRRHQRSENLRIRGLTIGMVQHWIRRNLGATPEDDAHPSYDNYSPMPFLSSLDDLRELVSPLARFTQPGDTIILCPSERMSSIPFHLCRLDGQIITDRNPVAYCTNLSMLLRCHKLVFERRRSGTISGAPKIISVNPLLTNIKSEFQGQLDTLNENIAPSTEYISEQGVVEALDEATMVHFQGYFGSSSKNAWDDYLDLGNKSRSASSEKITVQRLLQISLQSAALVTLVECASNADDVKVGMSIALVTAFMLAGASAVVTTLWDVNPEDCDLFVLTFQKALREEVENESVATQALKTINVAALLQKTTKRMRELDYTAEAQFGPPAWAAFVLQGYWRTPVDIIATTEPQLGHRDSLVEHANELPQELGNCAKEMTTLFVDSLFQRSTALRSYGEPTLSNDKFQQKLESCFINFESRKKKEMYSDSDYAINFVFRRLMSGICSDIKRRPSESSNASLGKSSSAGDGTHQEPQSTSGGSNKLCSAQTSVELGLNREKDTQADGTVTEDSIAPLLNRRELESYLLDFDAYWRMLEELNQFIAESKTEKERMLTNWWKRETLQNLPHEFQDCVDVKISVVTEEQATLLDRLKFAVERYSGERWDWTPLERPRTTLVPGRTRLKWECRFTPPSYVDVSHELAAAMYGAVLRQCFLGFDLTLKASLGTSENSSSQSSIPQLAVNKNATDSKTSVTESLPLQQLARSQKRLSRRTGWTGFTNPIPTGPSYTQAKPNLYILFCVPGRRTLPHTQINATQCADDEEFFEQLRQKYKNLRGFWRYRFSPRMFSHCHFIKATRYHFQELEKRKQELPLHQDYEYEGKPPPPPPEIRYEPPIGENEWFNRFHKRLVFPNEHSAYAVSRKQRVIRKIPKRKREFISRLFATEDEDLWGIQAEFCFSFRGISIYLVLAVVGGLAFWIWWLKRHPGDWQNAVVPLTTCATLLVLFSLPLGQNFKDLL